MHAPDLGGQRGILGTKEHGRAVGYGVLRRGRVAEDHELADHELGTRIGRAKPHLHGRVLGIAGKDDVGLGPLDDDSPALQALLPQRRGQLVAQGEVLRDIRRVEGRLHRGVGGVFRHAHKGLAHGEPDRLAGRVELPLHDEGRAHLAGEQAI